MAWRWIHLSDLHFGAGDAATDAHRKTVLFKLKEDIAALQARLGAPQFIWVTGDIAQKGDAKEYTVAQLWLDELQRATGAKVLVVPGNHDVARGVVLGDKNSLRLHGALRKGEENLDNALVDPADRALVTAKLQNFLSFAQHYGWQPGQLWQKVEFSDQRLTIVGLNTALLSLDNQDSPQNLELGQQQLHELVQAPGLAVVLGHHPPEWLKDGKELLGHLGNRAHLGFFGHVHQPSGGVSLGLGQQHFLLRASASHSPFGQDGYGYAWGELGPPGLVYYPRQWSGRRGSFIADNHQGELDTREGLALGYGQLPRALQRWLSAVVADPVSRPEVIAASSDFLPVQAQKLREARTEARRKNLPTAELDQKLSQLHRRMRKEKVLRPGDRVGPDFTVVREIGRGGFAVVYEVVDGAQNIHALKVLHGEHAHDASRVARFEKGAGEMARLSHSGIVKITHPYSTDGEFHYFGMTYLPGGNLEEGVLAKKIGVDAGLKLLAQVCEAVAYAHDAGVVHRDIKPSNILLDAAGQPLLTDFDLVKVEGSSAGTRGALGTFIYAAPEVMDDVEVDARADIFSLGMCAAFVLHQQKIPARAFMNLAGFVERLGARWLLNAIEAEPPDRLQNAGALCKLLLGGHRNKITRAAAPWADAEGEDQFGAWASFGLGPVTVKMRWIPPGEFLMGSPETEAGRFGADEYEGRYNEGPQHTVVLSQGFWLAEYPCTQALWQAVMGQNPSRLKSPTRPVEQVSWDDVQEFLAGTEKLRPGLKLGLPTEAQWEYACRAGTQTATYAGDLEILGEYNAPLLDKIAWYGGNCGVEFDLGEGVKASEWPEKQYEFSQGGTRPVGQKMANPWGLYDMLGNVWEWCVDGLRKYEPGTFTSARGPEGPSGGARVVRGGSWASRARGLRAARRFGFGPGFAGVYLGFRLFRGQ